MVVGLTRADAAMRKHALMHAENRTWWVAGAAVLGLTLLGLAARGATPKSEPKPDPVVATVAGEPIHAADVARMVAKATGAKPVAPGALAALQAQALEELIQRRLVLAYARRLRDTPGDLEFQIDAEVTRLKAALAAQKRSLDDYLKEQGASEADLGRQVEWNLVWPKYVARYATDERAAAYFEAHRRELDGSEVSASRILLAIPPGAGPEQVKEAVARAEAIRAEIAAGKLSFADAARKHSSAPSAAQGGSIGPIRRRGAMVESFAKAAFALAPGEVSPPVVTPFGVELVRCDAVKPGSKTLSDVRPEVDAALARELLEKLAEAERRHTEVKYMGAGPYFKPGTRELIVPCGR